MEKGKLVVYTGCSGVGKGTIMKELLKKNDNIRLSVSCTTRPPRDEDKEGVTYYFVTKKEFDELKDKDGFLEYATFCDNYYGTPKAPVDDMLNRGYDVFLEIEVDGGMQVMDKRPDCISIFITPPSMEELERRLRGRGTEDEETILKRMERAKEEMEFKKFYKYNVLNDNAQRAADEILSILEGEKNG